MQLLLCNSALKLVSLTKPSLPRGAGIPMPQHFWYQQCCMGSVLHEHIFFWFWTQAGSGCWVVLGFKASKPCLKWLCWAAYCRDTQICEMLWLRTLTFHLVKSNLTLNSPCLPLFSPYARKSESLIMKIKEEKHSQEKQVSFPASLAWSFPSSLGFY